MPTEKQIEAAAKSDAKFDGRRWLAMPRTERDRYLLRSRAALTAAEAVEVWGEEDAEIISAAMEYFDDDGDLSRLDPAETDHLLHLARVGAGSKSR